MHKLFGKFGKKTKIFLISLLFISAFGGVLYASLTQKSEVEALTSTGDQISISRSGSEMRYGNSNWSTYRYTVTNLTQGGSHDAMCAEAKLHSPNGLTGVASQVTSSTIGADYYRDIINLLLVTVPSYNSSVYQAFYNANALGDYRNQSWDSFLSGISEISQTGADGAFVAGHARVSGLYDTNHLYDFISNDTAAKLNTMGQNVQDWMTNNGYGSLYQDYILYSVTVNNPEMQDLVWLERAPTNGNIQVVKHDADTGAVINGATFALYNGSTLVQAGISAGTSGYYAVPTGYYCFYETSAPTGYILDATTPHCAQVNSSAWVTVDVYDTAEARGGVKIRKVDADTGGSTGQGAASIDGAIFGVYRTTDNALVTTLTISNGTATTASNALAQGSYYVQEISAGTGYIRDTSTRKSFTIGEMGGIVDLSSNPFTNQVIRGGISLTKTRSTYGGGTEAFAGVTFNVVNTTTGASVSITTDSNGVATTGNNALVYGTYTISEVSSNVNEAYNLVDPFTVSVTTNGMVVNAGTKNDTLKDTPNLSTTARDSSSSASSPIKEIDIGPNASITDRIVFGTALTNGLSYRISGELREKVSGSLVSSQTVQWTQNGETEKTMIFSGINTADFIGKELSIIQRLYVRNNGTWILISEHNTDLSDENETVKVKEIQIDSTTATSQRSADNKKVAVGRVKVVDSIEIIGLVSGTTYTITGEIRDQNGNLVPLVSGGTSKSENYTMAASTGSTITTSMELEFESSSYVGQTLTVYETLKTTSGTVLAAHPNASSSAAQIAAEQVSVLQPTLQTTATNNGAGTDTKKLNVGNTSVKDTVAYTGLVAGNVYTLEGKLINKATGDILKTETISFTASGETGSENMAFSVDTATLFSNGTTSVELVVFETLKKGDVEIAKHENLNDTNQTVGIILPSLRTTAVNNGSGNDTKKLNVGNTSVKDAISYSGLVPGDTYKVVGTLRNLEDGSVIQTKDVTFTPTAESGTVEMIFSLDTTTLFDATRTEQPKLVVYENLYKGDYHIGKHEDDNDADQTVQITTPEIRTEGFNKLDNTHKLGVGDMTVRDKISYSGLVEGDWYTVTGTLIDKTSSEETGETVILLVNDQYVRNSTTFRAGTNGAGVIYVDLSLDTTEIQGRELVVFETLRRDSDHHDDNRVIARHEDLNDTDQTVQVKVARVATEARDGNGEDNVIEPEENQVIVDTVRYEGLMREETYTLVGTLMNKETGEELLIDGEKVTARTTFTTSANRDDGTTTVTFGFDATDLPGGEIVVFERLFRGGNPGEDATPIATHEEMTDPNQYIKVRARIGTIAADDYDGDQKIGVGNVTVTDTIEYEGLKVGHFYSMKGVLVDKETGEPISGAEGEIRFRVATESERNGTKTITFEFSTAELAGKELVAFEELYEIVMDGGTETEEFEAEHKDLEDEAQTVEVLVPRLVTTAVDKIDLDKELAASGIVVINDKVEYSGLVAGTDYMLRGTLMDRETGQIFSPENAEQSELEKELRFTARGETGAVELDFQVDVTGRSGREIVVFEDIYMIFETEAEDDGEPTEPSEDDEGDEGEEEERIVVTEVLVAKHEDLNDQMQTVWVKVISPNTGMFSKGLEGAKNRGVFAAAGIIVFFSAIGLVVARVTKKKRFGF
ncbi:VaFE repeat-containing surface-anchored protein [Candidatus Saccharibacteria bacterium]|nr:VaFE repeat-containing surface-anchored protein [Candidatus Saccharibacteria bacterium]